MTSVLERSTLLNGGHSKALFPPGINHLTFAREEIEHAIRRQRHVFRQQFHQRRNIAAALSERGHPDG